jgi:hypothetical protein
VSWWRHRFGPASAKDRVRWSLRAVTLAAVTLTAILGGQRYFYCRAMDEIMAPSTCDCAQASADGAGATAVGVLNDCFEVRFLDRLVSFTVGHDIAVPAASLVAILPPAIPVTPMVTANLKRTEQPIRAGPFSPTASRSQLMVFLT